MNEWFLSCRCFSNKWPSVTEHLPHLLTSTPPPPHIFPSASSGETTASHSRTPGSWPGLFSAALLTMINTVSDPAHGCYLNLWVHCDYVTSRPIECMRSSNQKVKGFPSMKVLMGSECKWPDDGLLAESAVHLLLDEGGVFNAAFSWVYTGHRWTLVPVSCRDVWLFHVITMCTVVILVAFGVLLSNAFNKKSYFCGFINCFIIIFVQFHRESKYNHPKQNIKQYNSLCFFSYLRAVRCI